MTPILNTKERRAPTFSIAGVVQGARSDAQTADQGYRIAIRKLIERHYPHSQVFCPVEAIYERFQGEMSELTKEFACLAANASVREEELAPLVLDVRASFVEFVRAAASTDVLIAFLGNGELSMGTAMEMWAAREAHKLVITISALRQNLAILSCSTAIVPNLESLDALLSSGWLETRLNQSSSPLA